MRRERVYAAVFAIAAMGMTTAGYAAMPGFVRMPVRAMLGHEGHAKIVHFSVQNSSATPLNLKCGDQAMTVDPGKLVQLKLAAGSKVTFAEASGTHAAGEVLAEVSSALDGTTLNVH